MNVLSLYQAAPVAPRRERLVFSARASVILLALLAAIARADSKPAAATQPLADTRFQVGKVIFSDNFTGDLSNWHAELESGGTVDARDGKLVIDVPAGCTVWFKPDIDGPVLIEYEATVIRAGGHNDRVSDLNCFWMARDARSPDDLFATVRRGKFQEYNQLQCYYASVGGNGNTTTRFRRYVGDKEIRPLLPEHDLRDRDDLITPNAPQTIRLVACGNLVQLWRDDKRLFEMTDPQPYTRGHFAFRTVSNHMEISRFRVYRLNPLPPIDSPAAAAAPLIRETAQPGDFPLVAPTAVAPIVVDDDDHRVVAIAASCLADDIERVTGRRPAILQQLPGDGPAVMSGSARIRADANGANHMLKLWGADPSVVVQPVTLRAESSP